MSVTTTPDTLQLTIKDDGVGLPPTLTLEEAQRSGHFGLLGMAERAARTAATLDVHTTPTGTEVVLTLPLPTAAPPVTPLTPRQEAAHA